MERITIKPYQPANWFSKSGASKKLSALEAKGLPSFRNWRFITLTLDRQKFSSNESAYFYVKDRLRHFFQDLRKYLGKDEIRYIWKLEFQGGGWAHWHILLDYKTKIDHNDLTRIWKYGFTYIERVSSNRLPYQFKYVCKEVGELPVWFLALNRPRCFQSSGIFAPAPKTPRDNREDTEDAPPSRSSTLGERLKRYSTMLQVKADEKYIMTIRTTKNWGDWLHDTWNNFKFHIREIVTAYELEITPDFLEIIQMEEIYET